MGVRRVPFKDWAWEATGTVPDRWAVKAGTWTVQANTIQCDDSGGLAAGTSVAPAQQSTQTGLIAQTGEIWYDVKMNMVSKLALSTPDAKFIVFGSNPALPYAGNGYVLEMTEAALTFYRSDLGVLTSLATVAQAHSLNTVYTFVIARTATGDWSFTEDGVAVGGLAVTDANHTSGNYIALYTNDAKTQWSEIRARYDYCEFTYMKIRNVMTKEVSTLKFGFVPTDSTDDSEAWAVGEGVEALLYDGTTEFVEFWGKVETIDDDDAGETHVVAYDWRVELLKAEANNNANEKLSDAMTSIINAAARVVTPGGVKATAEAAVSRTMNGEYSYTALKKLAQEAGYFITYDGRGLMNVTDTTSASGLTIVDDDIAKFRRVMDLTANVNTVRTFYSGGNNQTGGSGTDYESYGRSDRLIIDTAIPDATKATARANYFINRYSGGVKVIDIWDINSAHAQLKPGDTATLTASWIGVTAATCFVMEKEFDTESGDGIRFRVTVEASTTERHGLDNRDYAAKVAENALYGLGMQV